MNNCIVIYKKFAQMWYKDIWMGLPMRLELICEGLLV